MTFQEIMTELEKLGNEQTKKTHLRHGAKEPLFGVKIGDMKKLITHVKKNQQLALDLYASGNNDAMYLAGLGINPKFMTKEQLQIWVKQAYWHQPAEFTVAACAAESPFALELAAEWIESDNEMIACAGWNTYSNYLSITPDDQINFTLMVELLTRVEKTIHTEKNRVRYNMNGFVIALGSFTKPLHNDAKIAAENIGKVSVNVGNTACKVPFAQVYIEKVEAMGNVGKKKLTSQC
ncbi:MAG: alkylation repair protein [Bacillales bacterium]|jgi:3-methyladenine DNA glycosylase AlkD|nr:alkylation repair protein [Bacillales bacterium]